MEFWYVRMPSKVIWPPQRTPRWIIIKVSSTPTAQALDQVENKRVRLMDRMETRLDVVERKLNHLTFLVEALVDKLL